MSHPEKPKQPSKDAIIVENVSKSFKVPHEKKTTVKENILGSIKGKGGYDEFWALRNVSFTIKRGESIGIIGENGSGKSTLLKILAGVLYPDKGNLTVNGRIAPFLELGVGFQGELTAKENVYLYGSILGMTKKEMDKKYDEILDFSELGHFENMKLKNFSSGMYARLAFATAVAVEPDILLLDEVLAVGDEKFQMKCREKINNYKKSGATIVLVSHSLDAIQSICDRAILFEHGVLKASGNVWEVGERYRGDMGIKRLMIPKLIAPLDNEYFKESVQEIILSWDINNPLELINDIELRIRDITERDDGKLSVIRLPFNSSQFKIDISKTIYPLKKEKMYRWTIKVRSSLPSIYQDSEYGSARIFLVKGRSLDIDQLA